MNVKKTNVWGLMRAISCAKTVIRWSVHWFYYIVLEHWFNFIVLEHLIYHVHWLYYIYLLYICNWCPMNSPYKFFILDWLYSPCTLGLLCMYIVV